MPECQTEQAPERGDSPGWRLLLQVARYPRSRGAYQVHHYPRSGCPELPKYHSSPPPLPLRCLYPPEPGIWTTGVSRPISSGVLNEIFENYFLWERDWGRGLGDLPPERLEGVTPLEEKQKLRRGFVRVYGVLPRSGVLCCLSLGVLQHKDTDFSPHFNSKYLLFAEE